MRWSPSCRPSAGAEDRTPAWGALCGGHALQRGAALLGIWRSHHLHAPFCPVPASPSPRRAAAMTTAAASAAAASRRASPWHPRWAGCAGTVCWTKGCTGSSCGWAWGALAALRWWPHSCAQRNDCPPGLRADVLLHRRRALHQHRRAHAAPQPGAVGRRPPLCARRLPLALAQALAGPQPAGAAGHRRHLAVPPRHHLAALPGL